MVTSKKLPWWLEDGRRYGYPDCCIIFFHRIWGPLALGTQYIADKVRRNESCSQDELLLHYAYLEHRKHLDGSGYVPCPGCLAKKLRNAERLPSLLAGDPCADHCDNARPACLAASNRAPFEEGKPQEKRPRMK